MKKILLFAAVIAVVLISVFYHQIIATKGFYSYQQGRADAFIKATISWKTISFSSGDYSTTADQSLTLGSLKFIAPFDTTNQEITDSIVKTTNGDKSLTISTSKVPTDFLITNHFSTIEKNATCEFLSSTASLSACSSEYNLYRAFLELNKTDIHIFSTIDNKTLYNKILMIRAKEIPSNTISPFETQSIKGFLFTINTNNYTAEIFDKNDQRYTLTFTNLDQAEVAFVLSNVFLVTN
ncbi:MAG: hypothetical protein RLZZ230_913 [Candidatus Parcubacteria bacterium]|jgi:hypothetical protein